MNGATKRGTPSAWSKIKAIALSTTFLCSSAITASAMDLKTALEITLHTNPEIAESAAKSMRQDQIVMRLARQFQLSPDQVRRRLSELRTSMRPRRDPKMESRQDAFGSSNYDLKESAMIQLLIQDPSLLDKAVENISPNQFHEGVLRELYEVMCESFHDGNDVGYEQLKLELEDVQLRNLVDCLFDEAIEKRRVVESQNSVYSLDLEAQLDSIIIAFNERIVESGNQAKISRLQGQELNAQEETLALEELFHQQLQKLNKTK